MAMINGMRGIPQAGSTMKCHHLLWVNRLKEGGRLRASHHDGKDADGHGHTERDQIIPELHAAHIKYEIRDPKFM